MSSIGGRRPASATDAELQARLGVAGQPSDARRADKDELLHRMLTTDATTDSILKDLHLDWAHLHRWKTSHPDWYAEYRGARETLADRLADQSTDALAEGRTLVLGLPKEQASKATALASLYRDESKARQWVAERSARVVWGPETAAAGVTNVQVVVALPALEPATAVPRITGVLARLAARSEARVEEGG